MPRPLNGYMTVKEAASYLGISSATLRNWDRSGKLRPGRHPVNGYRLYRREDLDAVLRQAAGLSALASDQTEFDNRGDRGEPR